jgi:hypothetical protein
MTTTLRSKVEVQLGWTWRDRIGPFVVTDDNRLLSVKELSDGAAAGQADVVWHAASQTLAAGQSTTLELAALVQSVFNDTILISLVRVKAILVVNKNATGSAFLLVGAAGADEFSAPFGMLGDTVKVMPASPLLLANLGEGWSVEPGHEVLMFQAIGGEVVFDIAILGTASQGGGGSSSSA